MATRVVDLVSERAPTAAATKLLSHLPIHRRRYSSALLIACPRTLPSATLAQPGRAGDLLAILEITTISNWRWQSSLIALVAAVNVVAFAVDAIDAAAVTKAIINAVADASVGCHC